MPILPTLLSSNTIFIGEAGINGSIAYSKVANCMQLHGPYYLGIAQINDKMNNKDAIPQYQLIYLERKC